ncbi:MAG TPA: hypothetical protein DEQ14_02220 [Treponema sp.]|nr:hypothetical protein [Treponema sp.]
MKKSSVSGHIVVSLMAFLTLAAVFSEISIFTHHEHHDHHDHECSGEHCSVCLQIQLIKKTLENMGRAGVIAFPGILESGRETILSSINTCLVATPVLLKVKFST